MTALSYLQFTQTTDEAAPPDRGHIVPLDTDAGPDDRRGVGYAFGEELRFAISAALTLGRPLLVTGEPGSGKTELGYAIARNLPDRPIVRHFVCRSSSEAKDLFYTYDALARFHAVQTASNAARSATTRAAGSSAEPYIRYAALGQALLDAWGATSITTLDRTSKRKKRRSVVIIDEIDKASRDFCNDLLDQIDTLSFDVPELAGEDGRARMPPGATLPRELRPIVIIASNSEKLLPEPFLRRCVFHPIAPPSEDTLKVIVQGRLLREFEDQALDHRVAEQADMVRQIYNRLRGSGMSKIPGTAELVDATMLAVAFALRNGGRRVNLARVVLPALVKDATDLELAQSTISKISGLAK